MEYKNLNNKKVVFDIDDTLNNLNEHVFRLLSIYDYKYKNLKYYNLKHNECLTSEEVASIYKLYSDGSVYRKLRAQYGADGIKDLIEMDNIDVVIHSLSLNEQVMLSKIDWIRDLLGSTGLELNMEIGTKTPMSYADVIVEDNLEYLVSANAKHKILIDKPYNKFENYTIDNDVYGIIRVESLFEAIKKVKELILDGEYGVETI